MMGVDPEGLSLRQYLAILGEFNARRDPDADRPPPDLGRLKRAMDAHRSLH